MSCFKFDFHTVCSECRGVDCDLQTRCIECTDVDDATVQDYVSHKLSLTRKFLAKSEHKSPVPASLVGICPRLNWLHLPRHPL